MSELSKVQSVDQRMRPECGVAFANCGRAVAHVRGSYGPRLCENGTLRIVFSIALCQQHLPVRLVSAATKSRWKFYALVQRLSFHTAGHFQTHALQQSRAVSRLRGSGVQLVEQGLGLLQIERVEALGEPAVDRREKIAGLAAACPDRARAAPCSSPRAVPRILPAARRATASARSKYASRFRCIRLGRHQRDFARDAMDLGLAPFFLGCFHRCHRFADAAPSVIELAKLRIGARQVR